MPTRSTAPDPLPVDERLVVADSGYEIVGGAVFAVTPAFEPHGSRHSKLSALLEAYAADGYNAASDMLTRTSAVDDFAPDGSIYPVARDPVTGGRQLEVLAFEVVSTETLAHAGKKAAALIRRGVRRVFAIDVERERGLEWSRTTDAWEILAHDGVIEDPALVLGLPVHDLVAAAHADDAVARALLAKHNPVLTATIDARVADARSDATIDTTARAIVAVLTARGLLPDEGQRQAIVAVRDLATLERWLVGAAVCTSVEALLTERPA